MSVDAYAVLGLNPGADLAAVKAAYRRLAMALHPDRAGGDPNAIERFQLVTAAYQELVNRNGPRDGMWRRARVRVRAPRRGADRHAKIELTLEEAIWGGQRRIELSRDLRTVIRIPAGAGDGDTLRIVGRGEAGRDGGPPGDALIKVHIAPHPDFRIEGRDAHARLEVSQRLLRHGGEQTVPSPQGVVRLRVPRGALAGQVLRVRGKGLPSRGARNAGDLYVTLAAPGRREPPNTFNTRWRSRAS